MSALNHVITWDKSSNCWKRISAMEASVAWGGRTVPARKRVFVCELCKQYVILTRGDGKVDPYFKHNKAEEDKNCPEHTFGTRPLTFKPEDYNLPLKLQVSSDGSLLFSLGLMASGNLPQEKRDLLLQSSLSIKPTGFFEREEETIRYRLDRLLERGITYVSVGSSPQKSYELRVPNEVRSCLRCPSRINGVKWFGTVFDARSGKRIPEDGDVVVNKEYWLLVGHAWLDFPYRAVEYEDVPLKNAGSWKLYKISVPSFSQEAATFFLQFKLRLTESPVSFFPLWPITVKRPYAIVFEANRLLFYSKGNDLTYKTYPQFTNILRKTSDDSSYLLELEIQQQGLMIATGRTNVLKYTFLVQDRLPPFADDDEDELLQLCDAEGNAIDISQINANSLWIPKNILVVRSHFDGAFDIEVKGHLSERVLLLAEKSTSIHLPKHCRCRITVGCDEICRFDVLPKSQTTDENILSMDSLILKRLIKTYDGQMHVPVPFAAASKIRQHLGERPEINTQLRDGKLPTFLFIPAFLKKHFK